MPKKTPLENRNSPSLLSAGACPPPPEACAPKRSSRFCSSVLCAAVASHAGHAHVQVIWNVTCVYTIINADACTKHGNTRERHLDLSSGSPTSLSLHDAATPPLCPCTSKHLYHKQKSHTTFVAAERVLQSASHIHVFISFPDAALAYNMVHRHTCEQCKPSHR
jgi:hypothetical protein